MKQTARIISTYSADVMGVCSALFELGGMTVMHDASGCNSTYTTHDEPRWYDMDSMVYISGLSEMEAIMGDDEKLIDDICAAAEELSPEFIAICGTPIPTMTGFDYKGTAEVIEARTGIVTMGIPTTGMNTYIHGASMAFRSLAERLVSRPDTDADEKILRRIGVNVLGLTPLDFSVNGQDDSICRWLEESSFDIVSRWAMGSTLGSIRSAANADVSLVVSAAGLGAAEILYERFGIPYVVAVPVGESQKYLTADALASLAAARAEDRRQLITGDFFEGISDEEAAELAGTDRITVVSDFAEPAPDSPEAAAFDDDFEPVPGMPWRKGRAVVIGEGVTGLALANAIEFEIGMNTKVLCAAECPYGILRSKDRMTPDEDDIIPELADATVIIADPLYRPICPESSRFVPLPSEAFSGRIYRDSIPDLISGFDKWADEIF